MQTIQRKKGGQEQNIRQNLNQGQIYGGPIRTRHGEHDCIIGIMTWEPLPLLMCHQLQGHWILNGTLICLLGEFGNIGLHVRSCNTKTNASYNDIYLISYSSS
jgi:hypothetical protein